MKISFSTLLSTLSVILLFVVAELVAHTYTEAISTLMHGYGMGGQLFFILMAIIAIVIPLWSNMFLLPFGVVTWGPLETALLCTTGWWIGSMLSFFIARSYKEWLLQKYKSLSTYEFVDRLIPTKYQSLSLIFLRMTIPVDVLSYALGLFSKKIDWKQNAITTLIGITPFAFIFSYIGMISVSMQIIIFGITTSLFVLYIVIQKNNQP